MKITTIKIKILLGLLPFFIGLLLFVYYVENFSENISTNSLNLQSAFEKNLAVQELQAINYNLSSATRLYALTGESEYDTLHLSLSEEFDAQYTELISKETSAPKELLTEYKKVTDRLKGTELLILSKAREGDVENAISLFDSYYLEQQETANMLLDRYSDYERIQAERSISGNLYAITTAQKMFIVMALIFLFMTGGIIYFFLRKYVVMPIENLSKVALKIQGGNLDVKAAVTSHDEIGRLALSFNSMTEKLKDEIMKRAKENELLRDLDAQKSQFINVAAHQLRTPLSGVKWALHMVATEATGPLTPDAKDLITKSYESNERMILLVNDMLGATRLETGELTFDYKNEDIHAIETIAISEINSIAAKKNITINTIDADKVLPKVYVDEDKVRQVLQNILENAIKYTPKGGLVEVITKKSRGSVVVGVKDNGIGIPKNEESHIFTRFFRGASAIKYETDGTGLGLFIAKELIEKQGGKIWFENNVGEGTTFYFSVPAVKSSRKS